MAILIFDYDGTLHDSMHIYEPAVRNCYGNLLAAGKVKSREITEDEIRSYLGLSIREMWLKFAPELTEDERNVGGKSIGEALRKSVESGKARLYEGALDVLKALKDKGHRLVYLSNCTESYMELHKAAFNLDKYFDEMYCSEQFDWIEKSEIAEILVKKWYSNELISKPVSIIAIGDRSKDMNLGQVQISDTDDDSIKTIWCAYGFGRKEEALGADMVAESVKDILKFLN